MFSDCTAVVTPFSLPMSALVSDLSFSRYIINDFGRKESND